MTCSSVVSGKDLYAGRTAAFATMHGKERALEGPAFDILGLDLKVPANIDTDALGSFTGDIPRLQSMETTAIRKARLGMKALGLPLGFASEGSYGAHPQVPFWPFGTELMVFVDDERKILVKEVAIDERPVFGHHTAASLAELEDFLSRMKFPDHAIAVTPCFETSPFDDSARKGFGLWRRMKRLIREGNGQSSDDTRYPVFKGLRDLQALDQAIAACSIASPSGKALVLTDMRAHQNPTRMNTIARLAASLAARIATPCPSCSMPGFGEVGAEPGLPCELCGLPTDMVASHILGCPACDYREKVPRPDGQKAASATFCAYCNL